MDHRSWYRRYIRSKAWAARRTRYFAQHGRRCAACGVRPAEQVHHLSYAAAHREPGTEPDWALRQLCRECHEEIHDRDARLWVKHPGHLYRATQRFLRRQARFRQAHPVLWWTETAFMVSWRLALIVVVWRVVQH